MDSMRTITNEMFLELFAKRLFFDLIAEDLGLSDPKDVYAEFKRLLGLSAAGVGPAVLPVGGIPPAADRAFSMVAEELRRSIDLHGDWSDYSTDRMMDVIIRELMVEAGEAEKVGDLRGEHGMVRELAQVAGCCVKAITVLGGRV